MGESLAVNRTAAFLDAEKQLGMWLASIPRDALNTWSAVVNDRLNQAQDRTGYWDDPLEGGFGERLFIAAFVSGTEFLRGALGGDEALTGFLRCVEVVDAER